MQQSSHLTEENPSSTANIQHRPTFEFALEREHKSSLTRELAWCLPGHANCLQPMHFVVQRSVAALAISRVRGSQDLSMKTPLEFQDFDEVVSRDTILVRDLIGTRVGMG